MSVLAARPAVAGRRMRPARVFMYAALLLLAGFYLLPVFAIVVASLKSFAEASQSTLWELSKAPTLDAYGRALSQLAPNFLNSVFLAVPATLLSAFLGSMNGYVLAKWKFPGANVLFTLLLFGMVIPYQSVLIPLVKFLQVINLYGGIPGLILAHVVYGIPICTLIFRNYYAGIPTELVEAGRIDGASVLGVYRYILFPISIPGFVVVMIWQFTSIWNEFLFAVVLTADVTQRPITVALQNLAGSFLVDYPLQMAGALLAALPTLLVYILLGRYFVRGLLAGSLKG
jgi:glucose/mannose transport system permease protein